MAHIDENTLELFVLGDEKTRKLEKQIKHHLAACKGCSNLYQEIKGFYGEVEREGLSSVPPLSRMPERSLVRKANELEPYFAGPEAQVVSYTEVKAPSAWRRMNGFRREHPAIAMIGVFAFAMALSMAAAYVWKAASPDVSPAYVHLNIPKGMMEVFNKENRLLWSVPGSALQAAEHQIENYSVSYWQIADLNSRGKNDVVTIMPGLGSGGANAAVLQIFSSSGRLLHKVEINPAPIEYEGHEYTQQFGGVNMLVTGVGPENVNEIFIGITDGHSPYCIVRLDTHGNILGEYWHFGNLTGMSTAVLADGKKYLILCGENDVDDRTETSYPVIVLLDPEKIVGTTQSVATQGFGFQPSEAEAYYVKLPNTDMNYVLHAYMAVLRLSGVSGTEMTFALESGPSSYASDGTPSFDATFSKRMAVLSFGASNASVTLHGELENQRLVKGKIDQAYLDNLKDEVRYWNGKGWVKKPVRVEHPSDAENQIGAALR